MLSQDASPQAAPARRRFEVQADPSKDRAPRKLPRAIVEETPGADESNSPRPESPEPEPPAPGVTPGGPEPDEEPGGARAPVQVQLLDPHGHANVESEIPFAELAAAYPNEHESGIARGHLFAIQQLLQQPVFE